MADMSSASSGESTPSENGDHRAEYHRRRRRRQARPQNMNFMIDLSDSSLDEIDNSEDEANQSGDHSDSQESGLEQGELNQDDFDMQAAHGNGAEEGHAGRDEYVEEGNMINAGEGMESEDSIIRSDTGSENSQNEPNIDVNEDPYDSINDDSEELEEGDNDDKLFNGSPVSLGEFMLAILTFVLRHKLTGQCLADLLSLILMICPPVNQCVKTLYKFKKYFSMIGKAMVQSHYFCATCESSLESAETQCEYCEPGQKVNFFLSIPILDQLQSLLIRPGFYDSLLFRFQRTKKFQDNLEDIYDGQVYREQMRDGFLNQQNDISFMWYSDGISIYKSANFSVWPLFLIVNELKYKQRTQRENIMLAGIWFGDKKPNPNIFLDPLHRELEVLKNDGHLFEVPNREPVLIRAKMLCGVCDLQAKCRFMRFKQWNGYFGCTNCMIRGQRYDLGNDKSIHVFPYSADIVMRRNDQIPEFAEQAVRNRRHNPESDVYGVKGPSLLFSMLPNLIMCMGIDAMHGVFLGLAKLLTHLWFDPSFIGKQFSIHDLVDIADRRLINIKPPSNVQKLPHSIKSKIAFWKALDYKLWFLYYSLPVLLDILPDIYWQHHCKVVSAISILFQESISFEQLDAAEELLHSYVAGFQELYGLRYMSINVHQLLHLPLKVRHLGPLWVFNCFFLEDLNGSIANLVHGSRHAALQICSSVCAFLTLPARLTALERENTVRLYCERLLSSGRTQVKTTYEITPNLQVVGRFRSTNPIPPAIVNALAADFDIEGGRCSFFDRLRKNSTVYVASSYGREVQKLSSFVVIKTDEGTPHLCKVNHFVKWTPCDRRCPRECDLCRPRFFCIVELFEREFWEAHRTPNVRLSYLNRVVPTAVVRAFSVEAITLLCFYMNVCGDEYIACPVNTLEIE